MKPIRHLPFRSRGVPGVLLALFCAGALPAQAISPPEWRHQQTVDVPAAGLTSIDLPPATLDVARPSLEDLRLLDAAGNEVPFLIEQVAPQPETRQRAKSFRASLEAGATTIVLETGLTRAIGGVTLETPAKSFIKAVRVEGSHDGEEWQELATGQPVFHQPGDAARLSVEFPAGVWELLRLTVDDRRSQSVPFTGAQVHGEKIVAAVQPVEVSIKSRDESPGLTRLALDLGAANLRLANIELETPDPLFTRGVTVATPEVSEEGIREQALAEAIVHRVALNGATAADLKVPVEKQVRSRELLVLIHNQDSPPLAITGARAERRRARMIFLARQPGPFQLLSGNSQCAAPRYDLAALPDRLKSADSAGIVPGPLAANPDYRAPEVIPGVGETGAPLDLADWKFRKPVQIAQAGAQQLELDLEVLSGASPTFADLRLMRGERQLPYVLERTSISRALAPLVMPIQDPRRPRLSRWSLKLPLPGLPLARLAGRSATPLFEREMRLWEEAADERGNTHPRELGRATWRHAPGAPGKELVLDLRQSPVSDTLLLETDNGDNPPIEIADVRAYYPVTRLVFTTAYGSEQPIYLYYGNRRAGAPRYDLSLVAAPLLAAEKSAATLGAAGHAAQRSWMKAESLTGARRIFFWGVLVLVVIGLLTVLARVLPKADASR